MAFIFVDQLTKQGTQPETETTLLNLQYIVHVKRSKQFDRGDFGASEITLSNGTTLHVKGTLGDLAAEIRRYNP